VPLVRFLAFVLAGFIASLGALSLTALIGSGDPAIGPTYTLIALAAAALGGVSLAGGVGGLASAIIGAADIYLLQSMLTYFNVSTFVLQMSYGAVPDLRGLPELRKDQAPHRPRRAARMIARLTSGRTMIAFAAVLFVFVVGLSLVQGFGSSFSIRAMLVLASLLAIAALGQTLVMILGGIDLSIPFMIGFANVIFAKLYGDGSPVLLALAACSC
jgi:ribose/xylose/arabinose/galactoside ABC-type transport system permease subunit